MSSATMKSSRKSSAIPPKTVEYLKAWMMSPEHIAHPYPTDQEKAEIMADTGIELKQLTNWFVNNRKRFWKPRIESKMKKQKKSTRSGSLGNAGGLSISLKNVNQGVSSPPRRISSTSSLPLYVKAGILASPHGQSFRPINPYYQEDDLHTISEGSSTSACNSDDESVDASLSSRRNSISLFGSTAASQQPISRRSSVSLKATVPVSGGYRRHEEVDLHVLRPEASNGGSEEERLPTIRDMTIKSHIAKERILATFKCPISYMIPYEIEHNKVKVQTKRDGEVLKLKKHYLKLYLATRGVHSVSTPVGKSTALAQVPSPLTLKPSPSVVTSAAAATSAVQVVTPTKKTMPSTSQVSLPISRSRSATCADLDGGAVRKPSLPPKKRVRISSGSFVNGEEEWKDLCQNAESVYCESLPGLEEAARMFGFASL